ncbi:hypothetical protein TeGR_g14163, partial [Tetraparma gracilis]
VSDSLEIATAELEAAAKHVGQTKFGMLEEKYLSIKGEMEDAERVKSEKETEMKEKQELYEELKSKEKELTAAREHELKGIEAEIAAKNKPVLPEKPRLKSLFVQKPRMKFPCGDFVKRPALEPPTPTSHAAVNHVPNSYLNSKLAHPAIAAIRAKASIQGQNLDHAQAAGLYSGEWSFVRGRNSVRTYITKLFNDRIAMYDGAMGTMIQNYGKKHKLEEEQYRGEKFKDWTCNVKGNNDMLSITQPEVIKGIYKQYLEAGSDLVGTNTFSSTTIAMADYKMEAHAYELNYEGARLAREACDEITALDPSKPRFVAGAVGPTNRTGSTSPDVEDAACRNVTFDELVETYFEQVVGLVDGGADILIVETIFDTLNAKAALFAISDYLDYSGLDIPVFISGTLVDQSGRTLSGQTGEAFDGMLNSLTGSYTRDDRKSSKSKGGSKPKVGQRCTAQ